MKALRPEVEQSISETGQDFIGLLDCALFRAYNITDEELCYIAKHATNEELETLTLSLGTVNTAATFTSIKKGLEIRNKYLEKIKQ
jgi:hypothetical protein